MNDCRPVLAAAASFAFACGCTSVRRLPPPPLSLAEDGPRELHEQRLVGVSSRGFAYLERVRADGRDSSRLLAREGDELKVLAEPVEPAAARELAARAGFSALPAATGCGAPIAEGVELEFDEAGLTAKLVRGKDDALLAQAPLGRRRACSVYALPAGPVLALASEEDGFRVERLVPLDLARGEAVLADEEGVALLGQRRYQEAEARLRHALDRDPTYANARYNLACAEALTGRKDAAFSDLEQAVARDVRRLRMAARHDEDLRSLRDDPRWQRIVLAPPPGAP